MAGITILISGTGSNMRSVVEAAESGMVAGRVLRVISDNPEAPGLDYARSKGIEAFAVEKKNREGESVSDRILSAVKEDTDLIVCAGFLSILNGRLVEQYLGRIINVHPSLIPAFCGRGMYGLNVHRAVLDYGAKISGCTVHFVEVGIDSGPVIMQHAVEVKSDDTPESLQARILEYEHRILVESVRLVCENRLEISGRNVLIK